jgi:enoyl reductase-like protein
MDEIDTGQHFDIGHSRELIERGYKVLEELVENSSDEDWLEPVETPFFLGLCPKCGYSPMPFFTLQIM